MCVVMRVVRFVDEEAGGGEDGEGAVGDEFQWIGFPLDSGQQTWTIRWLVDGVLCRLNSTDASNRSAGS